MATTASSRYLDYLPALFQQRTAAGQEPYLGHFLLPFEQAFQTFEALLSDLEQYFTPALTSAEEFLPWLATWIALLVDEEWDEDQRRRLISEAVALYRWRGTRHGLQRYLGIYTGLQPENIVIRELCWPQGMQIGVASQIGGVKHMPSPFPALANTVNLTPLTHRDYYVVERESSFDAAAAMAFTLPDPIAAQVYCPSDRVQQVMIDDGTVKLVLDANTMAAYHPATVHRRNGLADNRYQLTPADNGNTPLVYQGDPLLSEESNAPYRFIVELQGPSAQPVRTWLTDWLTALLHEQADSQQVKMGNVLLSRALRQSLTATAHAKLLDLYMNLLDAQKQKKELKPTAFSAPLTVILCEPLTAIERFVANGQAPADETVRLQLTSVHVQLTTWASATPLPLADLVTELPRLAAQLSRLTGAPLTNETRQQVATLVDQMVAVRVSKQSVAGAISKTSMTAPADGEIEAKLQTLLKLTSVLLAQPLTIQEALTRKQQQGQRKLHTILALEKPAHTAYALNATPVVHKAQIQGMVIGVHANIGLNTTVG